MTASPSEDSWMRRLQSKAGLAWAHSNNTVENMACYASCFGAIKGSLVFLETALRPSARGRLFEKAVPGSDVKVLIRLGTTDIDVFTSIFCLQERGWDFRRPPRTIVDAGAYTGLSPVYFAMHYPGARIIAIEADKSNFDLLVRNTAPFKNIEPVHAALWSHSGSLVLTDPGSGEWGLQVKEAESSRTDNGKPSEPSVQTVPAITVADLISDYNLDGIDLLKVNIEGSEREVFAEPAPWIDRVDAISIELHDRYKAGCSRSFFKAVENFPLESWHAGEVLVARQESSLAPYEA